MGRPEIRPLAGADAIGWDKLWRAYLAFYETELSDAERRHAFARLLDPDQHVHGLLAVDGDRAVGLAHFLFHDHLWRPEGVTYLQDLFVAPGFRGQGKATALIRAVYDAADRAGRPRVYWLTQTGNATARRVYDQVGRVTEFIRYDRA